MTSAAAQLLPRDPFLKQSTELYVQAVQVRLGIEEFIPTANMRFGAYSPPCSGS